MMWTQWLAVGLAGLLVLLAFAALVQMALEVLTPLVPVPIAAVRRAGRSARWR